MTLTLEQLDEIERGLEGVTPGPWYPGHLGDAATKCNCTSIGDETHAGGIANVTVGNGLPISNGGNDAPPAAEAAANMRHIARLDPQTVAELVRLARIGIALEVIAKLRRNAVTSTTKPRTLIEEMAAKGPLGDEPGDITAGKRKEAGQ